MKDIADIQEYIKDSRMTLVVNNDNRVLLDMVCTSIYKKYKGKKSKISTGKGLFHKLCFAKDKFIKIDIDFNKLQFGSSTSSNKMMSEFNDIKLAIDENNTWLLFKYESGKQFKNHHFHYYWTRLFDLILFIDNKKVKIIKSRYYANNIEFNIDQLLRKTKLQKLHKKFNYNP